MKIKKLVAYWPALLLVYLWLDVAQVGAFKQKYKDAYPGGLGAAKDGLSFEMTASNALTFCPCDVTAGSCDAYCCCDTTDCASEVIDFWNANYDTTCVRNAVQKQYKPREPACIDLDLLEKPPAATGLTVTERGGQACVARNAPAAFSEYKAEVTTDYVESQAVLEPDLLDLVVKQETYNTRKHAAYTQFYKVGDQVMKQTGDKADTFFLSQADGFNGYCSGAIGIAFM